MGVAAALGGAGVLGAGASLVGASSAANATKQAAAQQQAFAQQAFGNNQGIISGLSGAAGATADQVNALLTDAKSSISNAYNQSLGIISKIPSVTQEYPAAQNLSQLDFNFRDALKKQNLNFVLGDTQQGLRNAQVLNTGLANLDPSQWNSQTNRIINSNLSNLKALTVGEPTGSFANLSAQNLQAFSQQGLNNELQISDFFAKNGTVDPISPLQTAFGLQGVDQSIAQLGIQNAQYQGSGLAQVDESGMQAANQLFGNQVQVAGLGIQSNNTLASLLSNSAGGAALAQAQQAQAIGPAIGLATQGLTSGYGLNSFAPSYIGSPTSLSANTTGYNAASFQSGNINSLGYASNLALPTMNMSGTMGATGGFLGTNALFNF